MKWFAHFVIGAAIGTVIAYFLGFSGITLVAGAAVAGLSALVPDIDHESSKARKIADFSAPVFALLFAVSSECANLSCSADIWKVVVIIALALVGVYTIIMTYFKPKHRGMVHSISFAVFYGLLLFLLSDLSFALIGLAGFVSHLVADNEIKLT
jgi:inner membrane protein